MVDNSRRRVLQAIVASSSLFLPSPFARVWAQSEGALKLLRLPKIALVVGNSKYKEAPLQNPANDARAIGEALKATGFAATAKLDAGRAEIAAAIEAYTKELAAKKCVGLFYYAGHGIQLAWKNYMLPVDAEIDTIEDVQAKAVEVNTLLGGLTKAGNALNVIILDACRDNPFGTAKQPQQKGLSQMDAPTSTLLAYATAPGNVASDGEGANGLYTENLLREIKVPEAKLEDVFKRVRLGVRRKSSGQQIPCESTSLEDDFWFHPPAQLKKHSEEEKESLFKEEAALWNKAKGATAPGPIEEYLRRYPSGDFAELAQLQLDRLLAKQGEKKIQIASSEGNPFTKGTVAANTAFKIGDSYSYRQLDLYGRAERRTSTQMVERVTDDQVVFSNGFVTDLMGNTRRQADGREYTDNQNIPLEFTVGKHWVTRYKVRSARGESTNETDYRVAAREPVTVPAGTFNAFRVEGHGYSANSMGQARLTIKLWYDPGRVRRMVAREELFVAGNRTIRADRQELVSYQQG